MKATTEVSVSEIGKFNVALKIKGVWRYRMRIRLLVFPLLRVVGWLLGGEGELQFESQYDATLKEWPEAKLRDQDLRLRLCIALDAYKDAIQKQKQFDLAHSNTDQIAEFQTLVDSNRRDIIELFEEQQNERSN